MGGARLTAIIKKIHLQTKRCKGCGVCVAFCPRNVLKVVSGKVQVVDEDACIACRMCEKICPDYVIYLETEG